MKRLIGTLLLTLLAGCAGSWQASRTGAEEPRVLIMLARGTNATDASGYGDARSQALSEHLRRTALRLGRDYGLTLEDHWPMGEIGVHCFAFRAPPRIPLDQIVGLLVRDSRVESAQPLNTFRVLGARYDDPYAPLQHHLSALPLAATQHHATGRHVRIGLIDTGVEASHPDLAGRLIQAQDFVAADGANGEIHGTAVAGVIAAQAGNGIGIAGIAPDAVMLALRACRQEHPERPQAVCDTLALGKALHYAIAAQVHLINLSLTGPDDTLLTRLIRAATRRGIAVIAAAETATSFPAHLPEVIGVNGSERGIHGLFRVSGEDILTTVPPGRYDYLSGSSFAAAQVTGIAARVLEHDQGLAPTELRVRLRQMFAPGTAAAHVDRFALHD